MGQDWLLVAHRLKEYDPSGGGKMGESFFDHALVWMLARPTRPSTKVVGSSFSNRVTASEPTPDEKRIEPCLQVLPLELQDQIFAELDIESLVYANLSSPYFLDVARNTS